MKNMIKSTKSKKSNYLFDLSRQIKNKITYPIPFNIWMVNFFFQRFLGLNNNIPWMVHFTSTVFGDISIGKNVERSFALSGSCYIQGINGIIIDDNTIFAPGVKIISANHSKNNINKWDSIKPIWIGKNCWIGANAIILPGVQLEDNVIVGAGAVVTQNFSTNSIIVGNPARQLNL
jgi:acetyltransferase-like isoleucine patch superfamily enzyme